MDKITKALKKLLPGEKAKVRKILQQIEQAKFSNLDLKKLKGRKDVFRVRQGRLRIIFYKKDGMIKLLTIERRAETTYDL